MMRLFCSLFYRDYKLAIRHVQTYVPLATFVLSALFLHWIGGYHEAGLTLYVPGILLFFIFLALFSALDTLYVDDFKSGFLTHYYFLNQCLTTFVTIRFINQWLLICLPLVLLSPLLAISLGVQQNVYWLIPVNALATVIFSAILTLHSLLTIGNTQGRALLSLLTLPLLIPPFILIALFYTTLTSTLPTYHLLYALLGGCLIAVPLCLMLGSWGLKTALMEHIAA